MMYDLDIEIYAKRHAGHITEYSRLIHDLSK